MCVWVCVCVCVEESDGWRIDKVQPGSSPTEVKVKRSECSRALVPQRSECRVQQSTSPTEVRVQSAAEH